MSTTAPAKRVLVFAKAPQPGNVKTRLIPLLGSEGAAALHARLVEHTLAVANVALRGSLELHGAPADDDFLRYCSAQYGATLVEQSGTDIGERMHAAFARVLANGCSGAVLVGSDSPALTPRHLKLALRALDSNDAVFAPAEDGGYVLIGLGRLDVRLFEGISWGGPTVMDETRVRLRMLEWRWHELETLWDVDRPADHERLVASGLLKRTTTATPTQRR